MKKKRIVIILIIVLVIGGLGTGVILYRGRYGDVKLLARAETAIRAGNFDKAVGLAEEYIARNPGDWRGYFWKGNALSKARRYAEARGPFRKSAELSPGRVSIWKALADTYAFAASRILSSPEAGNVEKIAEAVLLLKGKTVDRQGKPFVEIEGAETICREALEKITDEKYVLEMKEYRGKNWERTMNAQVALDSRLREEANLAEASGNIDKAVEDRKKSREALDDSRESAKNAIRDLLDVVKADASRDSAAEPLVLICLKTDDGESLAVVREVIRNMEDPPPLTASILAMDDPDFFEKPKGPRSLRSEWQQKAKYLDGIISRHGDLADVKLRRAKVAMALRDYATTDRLCDEVIETKQKQDKLKNKQDRARLMKADSLLARNDFESAESILFKLKTNTRDMAVRIGSHYLYGLACDKTGKKVLAKQAMRFVVKMVPGHGGARSFLANSLLEQGYAEQALEDARAYYQAHRGDPRAILLYVRCAGRTGQPDLARKTLDAARQDYKDRPDVLLAVAEGFRLLRDQAERLKTLGLAADIKPKSSAERLLVARAMRLVGRWADAEAVLRTVLAEVSDSPMAFFEMARLHARTRRYLQAVDYCRKAVELDPGNSGYRMELAEMLFQIDSLAESLRRCEQVLAADPGNSRAALLEDQVRTALGMDRKSAVAAGPAAGRSNLARAWTYLRIGKPEKCKAECRKVLDRAPDSTAARAILARAFLALGQREECLRELTSVLQASPDRLAIYLMTARVLSTQSTLKEVEKYLLDIPGARADMVDQVLGRMLTDRRDFKAAAEVYERLAGRTGVPSYVRDLARLRRAEVLAGAGQSDQAITELKELEKVRFLRNSAMFARARLLAAAGLKEQSEKLLDELVARAVKDKDIRLLGRVAGLRLRRGRTEKAISIIEQIEKLASKDDAQPCLLLAGAFDVAGRPDEAVRWYRKAIARQPGNLNNYLRLAQTLDRQQKSSEALEVLGKLSALGKWGRARALFERGGMFMRWGLQAQAVHSIEQLEKLGYAEHPELQYKLARAFASLGQKDHARKVLEKITAHSPWYVRARLLLADLTEESKARLDVLDGLTRDKPGLLSVLVRRMQFLAGQKRHDEVVASFRAFVKEHLKDHPLPVQAARLALKAMIDKGDRADAADLASKLADQTRSPVWRHRASLLNLVHDADVAAAMLPAVDKANMNYSLLGVAVALKQNDRQAAGKWAEQFAELDRRFSQTPARKAMLIRHRFLLALAMGRVSDAESGLEAFTRAPSDMRIAAAELVKFAEVNSEASSREAGQLLQILLAEDFATWELAAVLAWDVLKARPACQWSAGIVVRVRPDMDTLREVLEVLEPKDCFPAQILQAHLLQHENQYMKAARIYRALAAREGGNFDLVYRQAVATEAAGRPAEALALYRKVWQATKSVKAANNGAYLVTQLHPEDPARLAEAEKWMDAALKTAPQSATFLDTKGWIAALRGRKNEARGLLRRAIKGLPDSPEVHYHLGVVEAELGNADIGRWHLEAAVRCGQAIEKADMKLRPPEANAVRLAKEALAKMKQGGK